MTSPQRMATFWLLCLALVGCGEEGGPSGFQSRTDAPAAERPWSGQLRDVRDGRSTQIRITSRVIGLEEWRELRDACGALQVLEIEHAEITDEELDVVAALPGLTRLKLGAPIGDDGAARLAAAQRLEIVNLPRADITDAGLASLARLPRLQLLRISGRRVTDVGLSHIAGMKALRFLHLIDVPVTDAGLTHLYGMTWLESFYLDGGECTEEGLSALLRALPHLHFHKDQLHLPDDPHAHPHGP
jgi:hypothetical protein